MLRDGGISGMELLYDGLGADVDRLALRGSAVRGGVWDRVAGRREVKPCGSARHGSSSGSGQSAPAMGTSPASGLAHREFGSNSAAASAAHSVRSNSPGTYAGLRQVPDRMPDAAGIAVYKSVPAPVDKPLRIV